MNDKRRQEEEFVRKVMARTSGSPCKRAEEQLPDLVAHRLEGMDRQLVQSHLEHCDGCRAVALTLGWLGSLLPDLAEIDPGPGFTQLVLTRTSRASSPAEKAARSGATIGPAGLMDRLGRWWEGQIRKPQFALQFAYAATVLLVLLTALPISPWKGAPEKALTVMQAGPGTIPAVGSAQSWINGRSDMVLDQARGFVTRRWQIVQQDLSQRNRRSSEARNQLDDHLGAVGGHLRSGELGEAGYELIQFSRSGREAWRAWWQRSDPPTGP